MPPSFFIVANALLSVDFGEAAFVGLGLELDPCGPENVDDRTGGDFGFDGLGLPDFTGVTGSDTGDFGGGGLEAGKKRTRQTNTNKFFKTLQWYKRIYSAQGQLFRNWFTGEYLYGLRVLGSVIESHSVNIFLTLYFSQGKMTCFSLYAI